MALYDVLEAAKPPGSFTFSELDRESVEFRYFLDGVLDASMVPPPKLKPLLVLGSQTHLTSCVKGSKGGKKNQN